MTEAQRRVTILAKLARLDISAAAPLATGLAALDDLLGGGLPRRKIVEWFGPPSSAKTTLALQTAARLQRSGVQPAWIDADRTFDAVYATTFGVTLDRLPVVQPQSAEEALQIAVQLVDSHAVDLLIVDSAAALTPRLELAAGTENPISGLQSRVLSAGLRALSVALRRSGATALFLNHSYRPPDAVSDETEASAGGPALKLHAAVRIAFHPESARRIRLRALKNTANSAFATSIWER